MTNRIEALSESEIQTYAKRVNEYQLSPQEALDSIDKDRLLFTEMYHQVCDGLEI